MNRKRSRLEIYLAILRTINRGENKPTRIMYRTNLSWVPLQQIFESLLSQDFIREIESRERKQYEITEKGKEVLKYFDGMKSIIKLEYETARSR
jgi:predicted transcriptional regulator